MKKFIFMIFAAAVLASCARTPKEILGPKMKIDNSGSSPKVIIEFTVYNDSSSTVFTNYTGEMTLKTVEGKEILKSGFTIPEIFPYSSGTAVVEADITQENLAVLAEASQIEKTELDKKTLIDDVFIVEEMLSIDKIKVKKSDIKDLLKGN